MKILIIGDSNSLFIKEYIEYVLLPKGNNISVICENKGKCRYEEFYGEHEVRLLEANPTAIGFLGKIPKVCTLVGMRKAFRQLNSQLDKKETFDCIHVHFLSKFYCFLAYWLRKRTRGLVLSYWGSDLLRVMEHGPVMNQLWKRADYITIATAYLQKEFNHKTDNKYCDKLVQKRWGIGNLDSIEQTDKTMTKASCKQHFGICEDNIVIAIGYNAGRAQQHVKVIDELAKLPQIQKDRITILLQLTYGMAQTERNNYCAELISKMEHAGIAYVTLTEMLNAEETAKLRLAADIFIHAQLTDAFSASVQEYLYTGTCRVFNPSWIHYPELDGKNTGIIEYKDFSQLPKKVEEVMETEDFCMPNSREIIHELSTWDVNADKWNELYI